MFASTDRHMTRTYTNPVHDRSCPDPFVLKHLGEYWAYCTGVWHDGRCFGVLHSTDLVAWRELDGAMEPLPEGHTCYWAPEVTYHDGRFHMYYSVGNEETMTVRVAVAERPAGPFVDAGRALTSEQFAIDPHVFVDDDGAWYMFYAVDFLEHSHIGTGTVVDRMLDPLTLEGAPRPVARARYDWQVYDPARVEKGGVRWHTVEGPFVLKRKGVYYEMFSGGNWQRESYGVAYATSEHLLAPDEWLQRIDGVALPPILRTVPEKVVGPGHNSVVRGPNNRELYCVYHEWNVKRGERVLAIDRLEWVGDRLVVHGPTTTPQPAPLEPTIAGFDGEWVAEGGAWERDGARCLERSGSPAQLVTAVPAGGFLCELAFRSLVPGREGRYGVRLIREGAVAAELAFASGAGTHATASAGPTTQWLEASGDAFRSLRFELNGRLLRYPGGSHTLAERPTHLALFTEGVPIELAGFQLTVGWEDMFDEDASPFEDGRWAEREAGGAWSVGNGLLVCDAAESEAAITREVPAGAYELVVNFKLEPADGAGAVGLFPAIGEGREGPLLLVARGGDGWVLQVRREATVHAIPLPPGFDASEFQQLRICVGDGRAVVRWGAEAVLDTEVPASPRRVGLLTRHGRASFDMVRVTATSGFASCALDAPLVPGNA